MHNPATVTLCHAGVGSFVPLSIDKIGSRVWISSCICPARFGAIKEMGEPGPAITRQKISPIAVYSLWFWSWLNQSPLLIIVPRALNSLLMAEARLFIPAVAANAMHATTKAYSTISCPSFLDTMHISRAALRII